MNRKSGNIWLNTSAVALGGHYLGLLGDFDVCVVFLAKLQHCGMFMLCQYCTNIAMT